MGGFMSLQTTKSVPEQGQIVTVRQRRYVVVDVQASSLPIQPLSVQPGMDGQNLLTLNCIEDDALGETLQVIWELEPGTNIEEKVGLPQPDGFDAPERLDAFMNAVRWGAVSSADTRALQAPFRSGIEIEDYQLDPLVRAIQMPRVNLLIADDVGLGKTVETGLVIQELIVRNRARTVLIVCPAGLQTHWRDQMRDKFGLEFRIVDSSLMRSLRRSRGIHSNPWTHFPRLITSVDFIKRDTPLRLFREVLPEQATYPRRFDIMVLDEAHNVSPSGSGHYAIDSQRTQAIREIVPHFEHKLFLSATPHNGYSESFSALLELLDNQRFARGVAPDRKQLETVMVRRLKSDPEFVTWNGQRRFPQRKLDVIEVPYTDEEKQVHRWLREYSDSRQQNAKDQEERFAVEFVLKLLKKRLFSSPAAFALTLSKHMQSIQGSGKKSRPKQMSLGVLRKQLAQVDEEYANDDEYEEATTGAVEAATPLLNKVTAREETLLKKMHDWAERASNIRDSKAKTFIQWLKEIVRPNGKWSNERVIIFTEYRATQNWLQTLLAAEGLTEGERLKTLYGGMDDEDRDSIKAAFQTEPEQSDVRILLATDAASEGIDLQNYCHRLVHFEIPWNPNRMEQRNGRIDRHGQKFEPLIYHFVMKGYKKHSKEQAPVGDLEADLEFLARAVEKIDTIREDLGKVGMVIASQVEEAMLGKRKGLDTSLIENDAKALRKFLKFERDLKKQVEQHYDQLRETQQTLNLSAENVQAAVQVALQIAEQPPLQPVPENQPLAGKAFYLPQGLRGSWMYCNDGILHPHTQQIRPVVFDHELAKGRDDVVLAHLNHRLVSMALRLLRAEVWTPEGRKGLHRVTARTVPNVALESPAAVVHARLVLVGGEGIRLHEEIISAGGLIQDGKGLRRFNVGDTRSALEAGTSKEVSAKIKNEFKAMWPKLETPLVQAMEARMKDRLESMQKLLEERKQKEINDTRSILTELRIMIERELAEPDYQQLELWNTSERDQYNRNVQALRLRLKQIPEELEKEIEAVNKRYADPQPRLFPVAVTFLVPEKYS
jgi:SNF2 family DNA or RNA helicase